MKKAVTPIVMLIFVLSLAGLALAQVQTQTQAGPASSKDFRPGKKSGPLSEFYQDEEAVRLQDQIRQKNQELMEMFAASEVDEEKARNLHREIVSLRTQLGEKRFDYMLAFKKRNQDWQPRFGPKKDHRNRGKKGGRKGRFGPADWQDRPSGYGRGFQGNQF